MKIKVLIPLYNDWQSVNQLIKKIDDIIADVQHQFSIIIINDCSTEEKQRTFDQLENINSLKVINMKINNGHARCIATGLKYIYEKEEFDYIIPMDSDGEDRPEEIKAFVDNLSYNPDVPIVGERVKDLKASPLRPVIQYTN